VDSLRHENAIRDREIAYKRLEECCRGLKMACRGHDSALRGLEIVVEAV
jgi:hypothetical protein